ncbi:MAG: hypothetical protein ACFCGT_11745 [Sandaracinaceae bacterium]
MSAPRIVVAGATTALSRRTTLRKAFLGAWHPLVRDCWLYSLADAQRHTRVAVHHSVLVVSHHHTTVTPLHDNLPEFLRRFHRDLSCALHALLCRERYDAPRELFDDRQTHAMRLMDGSAQARHLVYERLNPVAAGLVDRPERMPLRGLDFGLWKAGHIEVERPPVYFDAGRPERLRLELTPPPLLYRDHGGDLDALVYSLERAVEDGVRSHRARRSRPVLGARCMRRLHPWSEPRTVRESRQERVPTFRVGVGGAEGRRLRVAGAREVRGFRARHREAFRERRRPSRSSNATFPFGTYAARVFQGAPTDEEPDEGAWVARAGPALDDIRVELVSSSSARSPALTLDTLARSLVEDIEHAGEPEELWHIEEHDQVGSSSAGDDGERPPAVVIHRFATHRAGQSRRQVVLRDRRRGRPAGRARRKTGSSDPPE